MDCKVSGLGAEVELVDLSINGVSFVIPREWAERIGWERFFDKTEIEFSHHHIDDYRFAAMTWRNTSNFKF